jgi:aspartate kinase
MKVKVLKFGGSSVANFKCMQTVGNIIKEHAIISKLIIVLSAQKGVTNELIKKAKEIQVEPDTREMDMLISTGEQISIALLTMHLKSLGIRAVSLTASQINLVTDDNHTNARIKSVKYKAIINYLENYDVLIVAGFQGVTEKGQITTLGRGGSDLTSVAIAACMGINEVNIYSDVSGVYTTDPNQNNNSKLIKNISYQEMLEMASSGAKVINNRAVELAAKNNIKIKLFSTFSQEMGTVISGRFNMEERKITGVIEQNDLSMISIRLETGNDESLSKILKLISRQGINIDLFTYDKGTLKLIIKKSDLGQVKKAVCEGCFKIEETEDNLTKVSVIGLGMISHPGVAASVATILCEEKINIKLISCSEINISILINKDKANIAVDKLHKKLIEKE